MNLPTVEQCRTAYRKQKLLPMCGEFLSATHACPAAVFAISRGVLRNPAAIEQWWLKQLGEQREDFSFLPFAWLISGIDGEQAAPDLLPAELAAWSRGREIRRAFSFDTVLCEQRIG